MENKNNVEKELNELKNEQFILDYKIYLKEDNDNFIDKINLIILEGEKIEIKLNEVYCYVVSKNNKVYESFESLLNNLSPLYSETFWSRIYSGLNNNNNDNNNED